MGMVPVFTMPVKVPLAPPVMLKMGAVTVPPPVTRAAVVGSLEFTMTAAPPVTTIEPPPLVSRAFCADGHHDRQEDGDQYGDDTTAAAGPIRNATGHGFLSGVFGVRCSVFGVQVGFNRTPNTITVNTTSASWRCWSG